MPFGPEAIARAVQVALAACAKGAIQAAPPADATYANAYAEAANVAAETANAEAANAAYENAAAGVAYAEAAAYNANAAAANAGAAGYAYLSLLLHDVAPAAHASAASAAMAAGAAAYGTAFGAAAEDVAKAATSAVIAANLDDFNQLIKLGAGLVPPAFFARPLWLEKPLHGWEKARTNWRGAMKSVRLEKLAAEYDRWICGEFEAARMLADVVSWNERHDRFPKEADPKATVSKKETRFAIEIDKRNTGSPLPTGYGKSAPKDPPPEAPLLKGHVGTRLGGDRAAIVDQLDRTRLARVLAQFLRDPNTETPTTLSIEGPWGSGKSSLMGMIRRILNPTVKERKEDGNTSPAVLTVGFNPWRLATHEELWATFALTVLAAAREQLSGRKRIFARLRMERACLDWPELLSSTLRVFAKLAVITVGMSMLLGVATVVGLPAGKVTFETMLDWQRVFGLPSGTVAGLFGIYLAWKWCRKNAGGLLEGRIEAQLRRPDYQARVSFLSEFHKDFERALRCYLGEGKRMVVLIDDLDRCDVPRAAELMHGINLMLGDRLPLVYVLGLDRTKVAAGIAVKHRDLLPYLYADELAAEPPESREAALREHGIRYGYEFIEKFIQVPFNLPAIASGELEMFVRARLEFSEGPSRSGTPARLPVTLGSPAEPFRPPVRKPAGVEIRKADRGKLPQVETGLNPGVSPAGESGAGEAAPATRTDESHLVVPILRAAMVLGANPRRVSQLINLVRLQRMLVEAYGLAEVSDALLAKWTAVALRWPAFVLRLQTDNILRRALCSDAAKEGDFSAAGAKWQEPIRFLRDSGPGGGDPEASVRRPGVLGTLLMLSGSVPVADVSVKAGVGEQIAAESLLKK